MFILAIIAALVVAYIIYKKKTTFHDIVVAAPAIKRTDLLYGYYGCLNEQVSETIDHINLFMESQFSGPDKMIQNILSAKLPTILDVSPQVFEKLPGAELRSLKPTAELELRAILMRLRTSGALAYVKYIYPQDEPNISMASVMDLYNGLSLIKRVVEEFEELSGVKYVTIYGGGHPHVAMEQFDIIGFDDYGKKSSALTCKEYVDMKNSLLPGQKTIIVPGGAGNWGQNPTPFINFAQGNPEVAIVMPFIWFDNINGGSDSTLGIRSGPLKDAYVDAGKSIISL